MTLKSSAFHLYADIHFSRDGEIPFFLVWGRNRVGEHASYVAQYLVNVRILQWLVTSQGATTFEIIWGIDVKNSVAGIFCEESL